MSSEPSISLKNVAKCYNIYDTPRDRLKQFALPRLKRGLRMAPRQYYREFWALNTLSFDVKKGEAVGIIGRNGSGKSTLLQLICGTLNPTYGVIRATGRISALLELGSGFSPEFTGRENVYMNGAIMGAGKDEVNSRFDDIAAFAEIGMFMDQPVKTYSSGMIVRLAFAVAINLDPEIMVVDEALAVGDELFQRKCFAKIESMRAKGTTILFVSHSASQTIELCDRAILLDNGDMLASGNPRRVVGSYQKLLYAPPDQRETLRTKIRQQHDNADDEQLLVVPPPTAQLEDQEASQGTFDPNFVPFNTIEFESRGVRINTVSLHSEDGKQVNGLIKGRRYRVSYSVAVEETVTGVRFGMLIKTPSGFPLGGCMSVAKLADAISVAHPGAEYAVNFSFDCLLNPGTYFINAGVFGVDFHGEETVLHRKADVLAFRVLPLENNQSTEIVDFSFGCKVERND